MTNKINIGIVGKGKWGTKLYDTFNNIANVKSHSTKNYFNDILVNESIDAVVVATSIDSLFQVVYDSLTAGKHVFVEKPMSMTSNELNKLIELKNDVVLFGGYVYLYNPIYYKIKQILKNDPPVRIELSWVKMGTFDNDIYLNLISHELSILCSMVESKVVGFFHQKEEIISFADKINLILKFKNGVIGLINVDRVSPVKSKSIKILTKNNNIYYWINETLYMLTGNKYTIIYENFEDTLLLECNEFLNCIENGNKPISNGELGLKILYIIENLH